MRLLIAGGGTGGHLYPGVAVAEELLSREGHEVVFAGSARGIEARVLPRLGHPFTPVRCGAIVGKGVGAKMEAAVNTLLGIGDALGLIREFKPQACLGVGGYASFPVVVAARLSGVFTAIQEQNATPGLSNRLLSKLAKRIYASDETAAAGFPGVKTLITGTPLRNGFKAPFPYERPNPDRPTRVLVLGGSQGAAPLNKIVPIALKVVEEKIEVRHQAGRDKDGPVREAYGYREGVTVEPFIEDMAEAYQWAQLVIARSGAATLAELASAGRPAILVPFPHAAGNHQEANARAAEKAGGAVTVLEKELTVKGLAKLISSYIEEPALLETMAASAADSARRHAARDIVDDLLRECGGDADVP